MGEGAGRTDDALPDDALPLAGRRVVFTGRLASLSRAAAANLVVRAGGSFSAAVTKATDLLVVGRDGWPLRADGRPSRKLSKVEALQRAGRRVEVISEEAFLRRVGLLSTEWVLGLHPLPALSEMLGVDRTRIETWVRWGFLAPAEVREGIPLFDFAGVAAARSIAELLAAGVAPKRIARSLVRLRAWLPGETAASAAIARLSLASGRLALPTADGRWVEPTGQILLGYDPAEAPLPAAPEAGEGLYEEAVTRERRRDLPSAAELYDRLLRDGPDADVCHDLANVLFAMGKAEAAAERYRQAVEIDPGHSEAWNDLGVCLDALGDADGAGRAFGRAVAADPRHVAAWENLGSLLDDGGDLGGAAGAYRQALAIDPDNADAHRALADVLDKLGRAGDARRHWIEYLAREADGEWADYARHRLSGRTA